MLLETRSVIHALAVLPAVAVLVSPYACLLQQWPLEFRSVQGDQLVKAVALYLFTHRFRPW